MTSASSAELHELMATIRSELEQKDTTHTVFHGSWDWHSSVHGHWALIELANSLGAQDQVDWVAARLKKGLQEEFKTLQDDLEFEHPYGRAWLQRLMISYEEIVGDLSFRGEVDVVAQGALRRLKIGGEALLEREYRNPCWSLIQLWAWACHTQDERLMADVRSVAVGALPKMTGSLESDQEPPGTFFSRWSVEALLVWSALGRQALLHWLEDRPVAPSELCVIEEHHSSHHLAINASRAWGLWAVATATGDRLWRDAYERHVQASLSLHPRWKSDRRAYAHWVPQFTAYAALMPRLHGTHTKTQGLCG